MHCDPIVIDRDIPALRLQRADGIVVCAPPRPRTLIIRRIAEAVSGPQAPWLALPWIVGTRLAALGQRTPFEAAADGQGQQVLDYLARRGQLPQ